jgi:hypothetical protein
MVPLHKLQAAVEQHLQTARSTKGLSSSRHRWQGRCFVQKLEVRASKPAAPDADGMSEQGIDLGAFMRVSDVVEGSVCAANCSLTIAACTSLGGGQQQRRNDIVDATGLSYYKGNTGSGNASLIKLGQISSWAAVEAKLRELGLVHSDGCLHITVVVRDVA